MQEYIEYTKEWLINTLMNSYSLREVIQKSGRAPYGGESYRVLKAKLKEYDIDYTTILKKNRITTHKPQKRSFDEIFIKDSPVSQRVLRDYIKKHNLLLYECSICGFEGDTWEGKISLELDHINGDNKDNRLCNLRYLCPNCHATTNTYRGRNKRLNKFAGVME